MHHGPNIDQGHWHIMRWALKWPGTPSSFKTILFTWSGLLPHVGTKVVECREHHLDQALSCMLRLGRIVETSGSLDCQSPPRKQKKKKRSTRVLLKAKQEISLDKTCSLMIGVSWPHSFSGPTKVVCVGKKKKKSHTKNWFSCSPSEIANVDFFFCWDQRWESKVKARRRTLSNRWGRKVAKKSLVPVMQPMWRHRFLVLRPRCSLFYRNCSVFTDVLADICFDNEIIFFQHWIEFFECNVSSRSRNNSADDLSFWILKRCISWKKICRKFCCLTCSVVDVTFNASPPPPLSLSPSLPLDLFPSCNHTPPSVYNRHKPVHPVAKIALIRALVLPGKSLK